MSKKKNVKDCKIYNWVLEFEAPVYEVDTNIITTLIEKRVIQARTSTEAVNTFYNDKHNAKCIVLNVKKLKYEKC